MKHRTTGEIRKLFYDTDIFKTPYLEISVDDIPLRYAETSRLCNRRITSIFDKEPTTVPWMDTFEPGEVFFDIGANMGLYSLYAGVIGRARVFAFEPESLNFAEINKNIHLNGVSENVTAYCMAVGETSSISHLLLSRFGTAYSHHDFGQSSWESEDRKIGSILVKGAERMKQGSISFCIDELVESGAIPQPHHIKIDVDGFESKVIKGAQRTLKSPYLKTILLEVDYKIDASVKLIDAMLADGWKFSKDQVRMNRHEIMPYERVEDRIRRKEGGQNYIFFKEERYLDLFADFLKTFVPPHPEGNPDLTPSAPKKTARPKVKTKPAASLPKRLAHLRSALGRLKRQFMASPGR